MRWSVQQINGMTVGEGDETLLYFFGFWAPFLPLSFETTVTFNQSRHCKRQNRRNQAGVWELSPPGTSLKNRFGSAGENEHVKLAKVMTTNASNP